MSLTTEYAVSMRDKIERGVPEPSFELRAANMIAAISGKLDQLAEELQALGARMEYQITISDGEGDELRPLTVADLVAWHQDNQRRIERLEKASNQ